MKACAGDVGSSRQLANGVGDRRSQTAGDSNVTVNGCSVCCYHHIATRGNTPHTHTHTSCPRSISLPSYSPRLHRPPTLRQVCRISKLVGLRVIVPAPHVHTIIITHHHHHTPPSRSYVGSTPHALTKHPPPPPPLVYHRQEAVKSGAADGADSTGCHTHTCRPRAQRSEQSHHRGCVSSATCMRYGVQDIRATHW